MKKLEVRNAREPSDEQQNVGRVNVGHRIQAEMTEAGSMAKMPSPADDRHRTQTLGRAENPSIQADATYDLVQALGTADARCPSIALAESVFAAIDEFDQRRGDADRRVRHDAMSFRGPHGVMALDGFASDDNQRTTVRRRPRPQFDLLGTASDQIGVWLAQADRPQGFRSEGRMVARDRLALA